MRIRLAILLLVAGAAIAERAAAAPAPIAPPEPAHTLPSGMSANWWGTVQHDLAQAEYRITPVTATPGDGVFQAPNRAQGFRTRFATDGVHVMPRLTRRDEAPTWTWDLSLAAWGRDGDLEPAASATPRLEENRVDYERAGIVEWYANAPSGLELGFTIAQRPATTGSTSRPPLRVELALGGDLNAAPITDPQVVDFTTSSGALAIRFDHLCIKDALGRELPGWFEADDARGPIAIVVDDANARYPITIDPLASSPSWTGNGLQTGATYGYSVATAGDVNNDGFSDVIVGAPYFDVGPGDEGRAYVYLGSPSGLILSPAWSAAGDQLGAAFGFSVSTAGDVNGDGFSDVIVGAPQYDAGQTNTGRASVYYGSPTGLAATPGWTGDVNQAGAFFGLSVSTAGDVDRDGFSDVIVGAPGFDTGLEDEGRAFLIRGSAAGLGATASWFADGNQAVAFFGNAVAAAGDVNGDGFGDVIVGAPLFDNGQVDEGRAYVFYGTPLGLDFTPAWTAESNQTGARFGNSVATAGDVNGDGSSDVLVGALYYDSIPIDAGRAYLYNGSPSGLSTVASWIVEGDQAGASLGQCVATAGDLNGDGYADVVVGAFRRDSSFPDAGRALVYYGSATGLSPTADRAIDGGQANAFLGVSVATAGDVNGDGYSDLIVGESGYTNTQAGEGRAVVYNGGPKSLNLAPAWSDAGDQANDGLGYSVASAGDVNGDGFDDIIVGAPGYDNGKGRAFVFHGSSSGLSLTPNWTAIGSLTFGEFGFSVAGAGDVNGDGFADVIVGAYQFSNGQSSEGRVFVYHGSGSGLHSTPDWTAESNQAGADFGWSVAGAGDVNGDGFGDVIVGAPVFSNGETAEGRAFVYHGSAAGLNTTASWTAEINVAYAQFGNCVATAGDVNGDGFSDVIVGASSYQHGEVNEGGAFVYHGSPGGLSPTANWSAESNDAGALFGYSVATAGDVNGDGFSDVIVGAPLFNIQNNGAAFVYQGSSTGLSPSFVWQVTGSSSGPDAELGYSIATAGDVDGDGFSDVIVGIPGADPLGVVDAGRVFVYGGSPVGLKLGPDWLADGTQSGAVLGTAVASAGDVNGDGFADVILGNDRFNQSQADAGRAFVYLGNAGPGRRTFLRQMRTNGTTPIARLGRSDAADQFRIRAELSSIFGRSRLRMESEVKPFGTSFDGTGTVVDAFSDTGTDGLVSYNRLVSGLAPATEYHWRVRAKYDPVESPFQRFGPWMSPPTNGRNEGDLRTAAASVAVPLRLPSTLELRSTGANPAIDACELALTLPHDAQVRIDVIDVQGRAVTVLDDRAFVAGTHALRWDGRNRDGLRSGAGVYFIRARVGGVARVLKVVLTR